MYTTPLPLHVYQNSLGCVESFYSCHLVPVQCTCMLVFDVPSYAAMLWYYQFHTFLFAFVTN